MKRIVNILTSLLLLHCFYSSAQIDSYDYKRELIGISDQWYKIILPNEIFGKVSPTLSDIRFFGITENNDTVEAPYVLNVIKEKIISTDVHFKMLNVSHNEKGYFFTFEMATTEPINEIELDFKQKNYDWKVKLEGSQDQQEWFTVVENYRILSIKNEQTDFQFSKITFQNTNYRYFRLRVDTKENPNLVSAKITKRITEEGLFRTYDIVKTQTKENIASKQTELFIDLASPLPVSKIKIGVKDTFDYYRPITIMYLVDSFKTEQGWKYNFRTLTSGTLNSLQVNEFDFEETILQKLKIVIQNRDNEPLKIGEITAKGYIHEITVRFTLPATYFMTYGNSNIDKPEYDIARFANNIPTNLSTLELGTEQLTQKNKKTSTTAPLFMNKNWLWAIMGVIILLLGGFTIKMMKQQ